MSTAESTAEPTSTPAGPAAPASSRRTTPRIRPSQIAVAIGIAFALITVASGVIATVLQWHDDSSVQREVFGNIPSAWKLVFYTVVPVAIVYGAIVFSWRVRNWERGGPDDRGTTRRNVGRRLKDFRAGVYMQTLLRDPAAGIMHSLIYFSFLILLAVTTVLEINHQLPGSAKFLHGDVYRGYALIGDLAGAAFVVGVLWALARRYVVRPYRIRTKSKPEHALILGTLLAIGVTGFAAEMFRIALAGRPDFEEWSVIGYPLSGLVDTLDNVAGWHQAWWIAHVVSFLLFIVILPVTMLRHIFTSPLNMYLRDRERPKGAMKAMPNLMETELETFGASTVED
ncbi:MAG: respiratory nitrate reductase subunit gamma, partial [Acidimicrobiales bacterium]